MQTGRQPIFKHFGKRKLYQFQTWKAEHAIRSRAGKSSQRDKEKQSENSSDTAARRAQTKGERDNRFSKR